MLSKIDAVFSVILVGKEISGCMPYEFRTSKNLAELSVLFSKSRLRLPIGMSAYPLFCPIRFPGVQKT